MAKPGKEFFKDESMREDAERFQFAETRKPLTAKPFGGIESAGNRGRLDGKPLCLKTDGIAGAGKWRLLFGKPESSGFATDNDGDAFFPVHHGFHKAQVLCRRFKWIFLGRMGENPRGGAHAQGEKKQHGKRSAPRKSGKGVKGKKEDGHKSDAVYRIFCGR